MIEFTVYGLPRPAGSKTIGRAADGRVYVRDANAKVAPWKAQVRQVAGEAMAGQPLLGGPLTLAVRFRLPRPKAHFGAKGLRGRAPSHPTTKPDLTKLIRAVEDALIGTVLRDDAQVVSQTAAKVYGEPAGCVIRVAAVDDPREAAAAAVDRLVAETQRLVARRRAREGRPADG